MWFNLDSQRKLQNPPTKIPMFFVYRFVNIEPSAVEEVAQEPNPMSEASLSNNNTLDGKILSTEVGNGIRPVEEESTQLRRTNITESMYFHFNVIL